MRLKKILLIACSLVLAGSACGKPSPVRGTIEHKQYSAAYVYDTYPCELWVRTPHTTTTTTRTKVGNSYVTSTSSSTYYTNDCVLHGVQHNHMPASYQFCLRADADDKDHSSQGCIEVSPQAYTEYDEGSHYPDRR